MASVTQTNGTTQAPREGQGTVAFDDALWKKAVRLSSAVASLRSTDKALTSRISPATALALDRSKVVYKGDGVYEVASETGSGCYQVQGKTCECEDFQQHQAPLGLCKHRIAVVLAHRASHLTPEQLQMPPKDQSAELERLEQGVEVSAPPVAEIPSAQDGPPEEETAADPSPLRLADVPKQYVRLIQGKYYVYVNGLVALAHERGLVDLATTIVTVTPEVAVCQCVARFGDGRSFTDIGDATPANVQAAPMKQHFIRIAATRATGRALRRALNIDMLTVEEIE